MQLPEVEAAFVALDPQDGAIRALVGGFDFSRNKFNHVTQAWRQPGSSFKPFIYSAALEKGFTAATVINDEPVVLEAEQTGSQRWEPKNYDGKFEGPMRLRTALAKSKNMVSIRILQAIGPKYAQDYVTRFGFDPEKHPPYLTMALGAGSVTAWQMARAYSVFANGGFLIQPYFIQQDRRRPRQRARAGQAAPRGRRGAERVHRPAQRLHHGQHDAGRDARAAPRRAPTRLGRSDLAGKTGTTNEFVDAWFAGYQPGLVARRLGRLRPAADARQEPDRRRGRAADLDRLHGEGAEGVPGDVAHACRKAWSARADRAVPGAGAPRPKTSSRSTSTGRRCRRRRCCGRRRRRCSRPPAATRAAEPPRPSWPRDQAPRARANSSAPSRVSRQAAPSQRK